MTGIVTQMTASGVNGLRQCSLLRKSLSIRIYLTWRSLLLTLITAMTNTPCNTLPHLPEEISVSRPPSDLRSLVTSGSQEQHIQTHLFYQG